MPRPASLVGRAGPLLQPAPAFMRKKLPPAAPAVPAAGAASIVEVYAAILLGFLVSLQGSLHTCKAPLLSWGLYMRKGRATLAA